MNGNIAGYRNKHAKDELRTPYFKIDEAKLIANQEIAKDLKEISGVKMVLALKCFQLGVF